MTRYLLHFLSKINSTYMIEAIKEKKGEKKKERKRSEEKEGGRLAAR